MSKSSKLTATSVLGLIIILAVLWISGIIPVQIGKVIACRYVAANYADMNLIFSKMEFSPAHGSYFAVFIGSDGETYNFSTNSRLLPIRILFDPLNPHV